jgi:hypothetical protein
VADGVAVRVRWLREIEGTAGHVALIGPACNGLSCCGSAGRWTCSDRCWSRSRPGRAGLWWRDDGRIRSSGARHGGAARASHGGQDGRAAGLALVAGEQWCGRSPSSGTETAG